MRLRDLNTVGRSDVNYLPPDAIDDPPGFNLRPHDAEWEANVRALADDMKVHGYRPEFPVVVRTDGVERPIVISGSTRRAAAILAISEGAAFKGIPVVPETKGSNEATRLATMLLDPGIKLPPLAIAEGVRRMMAFFSGEKHPEELAAEKCGKSVAWVKQQLLLSSAPGELRNAVASGEVSPTNAVAMAREGDLAATINLRNARENLPAGKTRITRKTITKANGAARTPPRTPAEKAIDRFLAVWNSWPARQREVARIPADVLAAVERLGEH
jgi:hypothetical protein